MKFRPAAAESSILMDKWSLKPADHNATRVRNNQRRHRARVKSRIEELETRLEQTSADLKAALSTIGTLTAELEALRGSAGPSAHHSPQHKPAVAAATASSPPTTPPFSVVQPPSELKPSQSPDVVPIFDVGFPFPPAEGGSTDALAFSPSSRNAVLMATPTAADETEDSAECDCQGLPPSAPGESMMSCDMAFQIVKQQNHSGVEVATIKSWLGPGFRKAVRPGGTCRVETNKLYEILDLITSSREAADDPLRSC
ncbi:hypothetical protein BD289DRAFT_449995 [Coniella lustricola]|uniref:BZIP domain-containing protein n=1 Tax=Coniella lustricola TaxID=2025994 RepID=A0A2T3AK47_9PEZI|nr:hypothetical protein BD289DRAFT_449995 [Coniella lustricola]